MTISDGLSIRLSLDPSSFLKWPVGTEKSCENILAISSKVPYFEPILALFLFRDTNKGSREMSNQIFENWNLKQRRSRDLNELVDGIFCTAKSSFISQC